MSTKLEGFLLTLVTERLLPPRLLRTGFCISEIPPKSLCWLHVGGHICTVKAASEAADHRLGERRCFCAIDSRPDCLSAALGAARVRTFSKDKKVKTSLFSYTT